MEPPLPTLRVKRVEYSDSRAALRASSRAAHVCKTAGMSAALNHNHLHYFWLAARHRSITEAAREAGVSQPSVSARIRSLEESLDATLLRRRARSIELTEAGLAVFRIADEMFRAAARIRPALGASKRPALRDLVVGVSDFVPKPIAFRILSPLLDHDPPVRLVCREWHLSQLLSELALFRLDGVISDRPHPEELSESLASHALCETAVTIFARPALARRLRRGFPRSLDGEPLFLPARGAALRDAIDRWLEANDLQPRIAAEFEDRSMLKTFGSAGVAAFPAAALVEAEIRRQYEVERVGAVRGVRETFWLVTAKRRGRHPAVESLLKEPLRRLRAGSEPA